MAYSTMRLDSIHHSADYAQDQNDSIPVTRLGAITLGSLSVPYTENDYVESKPDHSDKTSEMVHNDKDKEA